MAEKLEIGAVFDPTLENSVKYGSMDVVIDAVGSKESRKTAIKFAKPGSVVVHIGLLD